MVKTQKIKKHQEQYRGDQHRKRVDQRSHSDLSQHAPAKDNIVIQPHQSEPCQQNFFRPCFEHIRLNKPPESEST